MLSEIVACGGIAERSPLMMQLLADTSGRARARARGRARSRPAAPRCSARWPPACSRTSAPRSRRRGPRGVRTYEPDLEAKRTYDRVYEIYRTLYEMLGRSEVGCCTS